MTIRVLTCKWRHSFLCKRKEYSMNKNQIIEILDLLPENATFNLSLISKEFDFN